MRRSQPLAGFAVGGVGYGAGIQDVGIGFGIRRHYLVAGAGEFYGDELGLSLVQLAAVSIQGYFNNAVFRHYLVLGVDSTLKLYSSRSEVVKPGLPLPIRPWLW